MYVASGGDNTIKSSNMILSFALDSTVSDSEDVLLPYRVLSKELLRGSVADLHACFHSFFVAFGAAIEGYKDLRDWKTKIQPFVQEMDKEGCDLPDHFINILAYLEKNLGYGVSRSRWQLLVSSSIYQLCPWENPVLLKFILRGERDHYFGLANPTNIYVKPTHWWKYVVRKFSIIHSDLIELSRQVRISETEIETLADLRATAHTLDLVDSAIASINQIRFLLELELPFGTLKCFRPEILNARIKFVSTLDSLFRDLGESESSIESFKIKLETLFDLWFRLYLN
jgi:hypothetical protein